MPFKRAGTKMLRAVDGLFRTTEEFYYSLLERTPSEQQRLLAQLETGRASLTAAERSLFDRGMARSEPESLVPRLRDDIAAGRLPKVSWLVPSAVDSEHPGASTPVGSANLIHEVLDALASDRDTWSKTVLFINFDENDRLGDHVPPPAPPPLGGEGDDQFEGKPIGLATRVPMTIVVPMDDRRPPHPSAARLDAPRQPPPERAVLVGGHLDVVPAAIGVPGDRACSSRPQAQGPAAPAVAERAELQRHGFLARVLELGRQQARTCDRARSRSAPAGARARERGRGNRGAAANALGSAGAAGPCACGRDEPARSPGTPIAAGTTSR